MTSIENFRYSEFIKQDPSLIQKYTTILFMMEGIPIKTEVEELTLDQVEQIKHGLFDDEEMPKIFGWIEGITPEEFQDMRIIELFGKLITIKEQIEAISDKEAKYLTPEFPNSKWEMVDGPSEMKRFGILPMVDGLAGGDILKWQAILDMKYSLVFAKLSYDTVMGDLNHKMQNIKTSKHV